MRQPDTHPLKLIKLYNSLCSYIHVQERKYDFSFKSHIIYLWAPYIYMQ